MTGTSDRGEVRFRLRTFRFLLPLLITALPGAGCSDAGGSGSAEGAAGVTTVVSDSAGVEIVTNRGTGWTAEEAWRLEAELQVGELDGPLAFGRVSWVAPGPENGMLVLDRQAHLVHVFDAEGRHVREFGGEGDGPGEFRSPAVITPVDSGRLAVAQTFPPVLHWLTLEGDYVRSTRLPAARSEEGNQTAGTFGLWQVTSAGRVFAQAQVIDPGADDGEMPAVLIEIVADEDQPPDTISEWTWQSPVGDAPIRMYDPVPVWMPRSGGTVVLSPGAPYEYREHDSGTGIVRIVRRDVEPIPITEKHRDQALTDMRENMESAGSPEEFIDQWLDRLEFESVVPDVLRIWVSEPDGRVWVGVYDPTVDEAAPEPTGIRTNAWDVFERDGAYLGRIPVPADFRITVVTENGLYGVWEDELEVPFARRYRIVRPG